MPEAGSYDARAELVSVLLQKVQEDQYPSSTMLDMLEQMMTPDELPEYVETLLGLVREERFPSIPMLQRIRNLT